ncbi:MAG: DUF1667 domain-containing protein [Atopobiaceae bacterium]
MATQTRELTCINCPMGCQVSVTMEDGVITSITGNTCPRGAAYARTEVTDPRRVVTTTVPVDGSPTERRVSVKTAQAIPKGLVFDCVRVLSGVRVKAPVRIGDVVLPDVCGTGVDVVATKNA